jgi:Helicase subunit of the DNA excision repair complex
MHQSKIIQNLEKYEKEMKVAADLLEFELAARLRDELKEIKKEIMELPS